MAKASDKNRTPASFTASRSGTTSHAGNGSCLFVIFGATGDLTRRKLLPALYRLVDRNRLPAGSQVLGVGRDAAIDDRQFRMQARAALAAAGIAATRKRDQWCESRLHYESVSDQSGADLRRVSDRVNELDHAGAHGGRRVFYLALPPVAFPTTIDALGRAGLNRSSGWTRLVIEKPFGHDLVSAQRLNALVHRYFDERQVYRIDHYLGKDTVQNLLAFRFGNALFESAWNREHIRSVRIGVAEELGVEQRAAYYEEAGVLRDMVQNHLTQLLTLIAMEVPAAFNADSIRFEKVKALRAVAPIRDDAVVLGQYAAGRNKKKLAGYREEPGVSARSKTATFAALKLDLENWRWHGVPFYLFTGKRLAQRSTQIAINFRSPPIALFRSIDGCTTHPNVLVITLQPGEGFTLSFDVKSPGDQFTLETQYMDFRYDERFGPPLSEGYETLLLEIVEGDQTLFVHADEAETSWQLYAPLLSKRLPLHSYAAGSAGPAAAIELMQDAADAQGGC